MDFYLPQNAHLIKNTKMLAVDDWFRGYLPEQSYQQLGWTRTYGLFNIIKGYKSAAPEIDEDHQPVIANFIKPCNLNKI